MGTLRQYDGVKVRVEAIAEAMPGEPYEPEIDIAPQERIDDSVPPFQEIPLRVLISHWLGIVLTPCYSEMNSVRDTCCQC